MQNEIGEPKRRTLAGIRFLDRARPARSEARDNVASSVGGSVESRRAAYAELIAAQEAYLLRAATRLCQGRREDAQDLTQETLARGYEAFVAGRFAEGSNARAWFLRIQTNLYINERRRQKWVSDVDLSEMTRDGSAMPDALQACPADRPDTALLGETLDEPLENALGSLSDELRICAMLVDMEAFSYAEAAEILNIPVGTVRSRLWRARRLLQELLRDYAQERRRI